MSGANSFGQRLVLTTFGESHGVALGAVIDGVPAGIKWDDELLRTELERRRPGTSSVVSARGESDAPEVLSGVYLGKTLGTPIAVVIRNLDQRSGDYKKIARAPRPGHADDVWRDKFGHSDPRGGGRSSGRETVCRVIGGAVAKMILQQKLKKFRITGFALQIGPHEMRPADLKALAKINRDYAADAFVARFPSRSQQAAVQALLERAKEDGRSYGGMVELWAQGIPKGLGQPVFHKLKADLAAAFLSVGATCSLEIGEGHEAIDAEGSEFHRRANSQDDRRYGGLRGGITTGEKLIARVGFKPTSTVLDTAKKGRHDPCIVPRAIPVLESMMSLVLADHLLWARTDRF